jgi:hypothetical protein
MKRAEFSELRSYLYAAGYSLADWLNLEKRKVTPDQASVSSYIRWAKLRRGAMPEAAGKLFIKPIQERLRHVPRYRLDLEGATNRDINLRKLVEISRAGLIDRMRECPRCRDWYFATDPRQKFCGPECRSGFFGSHAGRERAALRNRLWRIERAHMPAVGERIAKLRKLPASKAVARRLDVAQQRQAALLGEWQEITAKLDQVPGTKYVTPKKEIGSAVRIRADRVERIKGRVTQI